MGNCETPLTNPGPQIAFLGVGTVAAAGAAATSASARARLTDRRRTIMALRRSATLTTGERPGSGHADDAASRTPRRASPAATASAAASGESDSVATTTSGWPGGS